MRHTYLDQGNIIGETGSHANFKCFSLNIFLLKGINKEQGTSISILIRKVKVKGRFDVETFHQCQALE